MSFTKAFVPYGGYWSSPFCKWQGGLADLHPIKLAGEVGAAALQSKGIDPKNFDSVFLGWTIPSPHCFYGGPWIAALLGADHVTGPIFSQACATSARMVTSSAAEIEQGSLECVLNVATDRCSNGPHIVYPNPHGPGAKPIADDWVMDNFGFDPWAKSPMFVTGENVAAENNITREQQDDVAFLRYEQYQAALADDRAFQRRYMVSAEVNPSGRKVLGVVEADEGVFPTTREGLGKLRPVAKEGTITFGSQTHPADGNTGMIVASKERAAELSTDAKIEISIIGFGTAREKMGYMAAATIPATRAAMADAGLDPADFAAVKTHNPFAVNDVVLAKEIGLDLMSMNNFGSSMIWGHPQGPTALRSVIELIEELVQKGGGYGLFAGCAAGDTAAGFIIKVDC